MEELALAKDHGLRSIEARTHLALRDLARKRNDLDAYIQHGDEHSRISEEIRGKDAALKVAMHAKDSELRAEREEREREKALLYGALPRSIADRMLRGEDVSGDHFASACVLFLDIAGFTRISDRIPPAHVVHLLKAIFKVCDTVCRTHGLTKIKTIGDSYMAVGGVPEPLDEHVDRTAQAALEMIDALQDLELTMDPSLGDTAWTQDVEEIQVRIGLHCGPLVAGIVGDERLQYDVWGDTVNVASRMESAGQPGKIQVSTLFAESLGVGPWTLKPRGSIEIKGKGAMETYWLEKA